MSVFKEVPTHSGAAHPILGSIYKDVNSGYMYCNTHKVKWKSYTRNAWWPISFEWAAKIPSGLKKRWFTHHYIHHYEGLGQVALTQVFHFGRLVVFLGKRGYKGELKPSDSKSPFILPIKKQMYDDIKESQK